MLIPAPQTKSGHPSTEPLAETSAKVKSQQACEVLAVYSRLVSNRHNPLNPFYHVSSVTRPPGDQTPIR